jgi:hypothetical protein
MKNSTILMYYGFIIGTFLGMIIHIRLMIDTNKPIHLLCFFLWMIMCSCVVFIFKHELKKGGQ